MLLAVLERAGRVDLVPVVARAEPLAEILPVLVGGDGLLGDALVGLVLAHGRPPDKTTPANI